MSLGFPPPRQLWTEARCRFLSLVFGLSSNVMILLLITSQNLTLDLESNFEKLRKTRIFGFFSILQFLVSALEIPSRFRFRSGSLDFFLVLERWIY